MESHGLPGRVQVSESTYAYLEGSFDFEPRGTIDVKGKGPMKTYLLVGERTSSGRPRPPTVEA
jgi:guanylate cyclase